MVSNKKNDGFGLSDYAPKYRVVASHLRDQIRTGNHRPNDLFMSESQLTEQHGVSRATIRQALDVLVQEGLLFRQQGKGTFIAEITKKVYPTTLVFSYPNVSSLRHPYTGRLFDSFQSELDKWAREHQRNISVQCIRQAKSREHGCFSLLHTDDPMQEQTINPKFIQGLCLMTTVPSEEIGEIQKRGIQCVMIGGDSHYLYHNVFSDPLATKLLAFNHLRELGHRDIGLVMTEEFSEEQEQKLLGKLVSRGKKMGLNISEKHNVVCGDYRQDLAFEAVKDLLKSSSRPSALCCYDDYLAMGALEAAENLGLDVPGDLSIVGTGNYVPQVNLTTVQTPLAQMGLVAARMLAGLVFDTFNGPTHVQVDGQRLILGQTTAPPGVKTKKSPFKQT
jgi:GntR family transcriptional regulator of arabinose operon